VSFFESGVLKPARVYVDKDECGGFYWYLRAANGMVLCRSESKSYPKRRDVERALNAIEKCFRVDGDMRYVDLSAGGVVRVLGEFGG